MVNHLCKTRGTEALEWSLRAGKTGALRVPPFIHIQTAHTSRQSLQIALSQARNPDRAGELGLASYKLYPYSLCKSEGRTVGD